MSGRIGSLVSCFLAALWCANAAAQEAADAGAGAGDASAAGPDIGPELGVLLQPRPEIQAHAYADVERVLLGETFNLLIVISADSGDQVNAELPSALSLGPAFEPGRRRQERRTRLDGAPMLEVQVEVVAWRVGRQVIPPIAVVVPERGELRTVHTGPVRVEVVGLVVDDQATIRDGTVPVAVVRRDTRRIYVLVAGLVFALALIAGGWAWRRARRRPRPRVVRPMPPGSPGEAALQALRALADTGALEADDNAPAFHAMAEIVRAYLGQRFELSGHDMTTAELVAELEQIARRPDAPENLAALIATTIHPWLETCDLVKFAGARASTEDAVLAYKDAIDVVEKTAHPADHG